MTFSIRFVLLSPRSAENVGAVARALKNFGHREWAVVQPQYEDVLPAVKMAVQSEDVLEARKSPANFAEAVSDCAWIVGTSSRQIRGRRRLRPRAFAEEATQRLAAGNVALVFGEERSGLSNEELEQCHDLSTIPSDPAQPSLNLAQAVMLYAYELRLASERVEPVPALPLAATEAELRAIRAVFANVLKSSQFLHDDERHAMADLLAALERSRLTRDEARLWLAALHAIRKRLGG